MNNPKNDTVQRTIHIGLEPANPDLFRTVTRRTGSTTSHYGGGPFNIHAGIATSNRSNTPRVRPTALPNLAGGLISDHSNQRLIDRTAASNYEPEIDHIVERSNRGSNSYSNARVLSKTENTNGSAARPGPTQIVTRAHKGIRIRDIRGYDSTVNQGNALDANDNRRINTFGGIATAIDANSGDVKNNVRIDEL